MPEAYVMSDLMQQKLAIVQALNIKGDLERLSLLASRIPELERQHLDAAAKISGTKRMIADREKDLDLDLLDQLLDVPAGTPKLTADEKKARLDARAIKAKRGDVNLASLALTLVQQETAVLDALTALHKAEREWALLSQRLAVRSATLRFLGGE